MLPRIEFLFKDHLDVDRNSKLKVKLNNKDNGKGSFEFTVNVLHYPKEVFLPVV